MPTDKSFQKKIFDRINDSGNGPQASLSAEQAAGQQAIKALAELTELVRTISFNGSRLGGLVNNLGARQLANDTGLWTHATVDDWILFENRLASAAAALYYAAQLRGMDLDKLAKARVDLDAEIKRRENHSQR